MHGSQETNNVQLDNKSSILAYSIYSFLSVLSVLFLISILNGKFDSK